MTTTTVDAIPWVRTSEGAWHIALGNNPLHEPVRMTTVCHLRTVACREDRPPSPRWHRDQICNLCASEIREMGEPLPRWLETV
jgi:hypothetical protein